MSVADWENLVKKQLKTENIYDILSKENSEGIQVMPYYEAGPYQVPLLPRCEESTLLVAKYHEDIDDQIFAVLADTIPHGITDKTVFLHKAPDQTPEIGPNRLLSVVDVFDETHGAIDENLGKKLLSFGFERNIGVDVSKHQNSGATITMQLAAALAKAKDIAEIFGAGVLKKLTFRFATGSNYFFEIAKYRAFKLLFNSLSKEFNLDEIPYIFAETSRRNKSLNDPENNLIRSTLEIAAAMAAGADAVFVNDYKIAKGDLLSEEISFKQQIVLAYESILNVFDDAGNGSYYIEAITRQLAENAWELFLEIEESGGYSKNIQSGKIQAQIYRSAVLEQQKVLDGTIRLVGVNIYPALKQTKEIESLYDVKVLNEVRLSEIFE